MKINDKDLDLKKYENMYDTFDPGHNRNHMEAVRGFAVELAKKYAPEQVDLAYIAATLHDIGLSVARENHEGHGATIILEDPYLKSILTPGQLEVVVETVREHRASSGKPESVVAKIVSDADKGGATLTTASAIQRSYDYGKAKYEGLSDDEQFERAMSHLAEKFGEKGTGTRVYFPETKEKMDKVFAPIIEAVKTKDISKIKELMKA